MLCRGGKGETGKGREGRTSSTRQHSYLLPSPSFTAAHYFLLSLFLPYSGAPTGRVISSPNTNPTLTVDGTNLNIHASQLPTRRESTNSTTTVSSSSSRRRDTVTSNNTTIEEGSSPPSSSTSATPPSSFYQQQQQQPHSGVAVARTISTSSNSSYSRPPPNQQRQQQQQQPSSSSSSSYPSSSAGPSSQSQSYHPDDRSFSPTPSHRSEFGSNHPRSETPSASIASRPTNQPLSTSSRHGRTSSASGRYPTFQPSSEPPASSSSSVYTPSVYGDSSSTRERVERVAVSEDFHFPRPSKEEVDRMFEGLMCECFFFEPGFISQTLSRELPSLETRELTHLLPFPSLVLFPSGPRILLPLRHPFLFKSRRLSSFKN